ncbi:ABC transporter permease subunit/CPBP intramembrane protease [Thalassoglobus sp.]|uniref:ABC transporter permease subunit/CPBP intramembrane protease n=1 Tax=Thalassoglobus sp. TaxID=2795869 RepID=UPI003AA8F8FE
MNWTNIKLIFLREVRDQLRDRRTLFMVAVLPLLLYPALGIGMVQMTVTFTEQTRNVVIIGADEIPPPDLVKDHRIVSDFFNYSEDADKLRVITDAPDSLSTANLDEKTRNAFRDFMKRIEIERATLLELADVQDEIYSLVESKERQKELTEREIALRKKVTSWFSKSPAQVLVIFPKGFREHYESGNKKLAAGDFDLEPGPRTIILHNSADEKSEIAYQRVKQALREWEAALLAQRLDSASLPASLPDPVQSTLVDLVEADEIAANVWSKIFPALLVIMSVTGAFYPAIDLGAGEKERGTMETLLISPATRTEIVLGKFLTVMLFSISTALLNLASMGFTGQHMLTAIGSTNASAIGDLSFPPMLSLMWVVLLAVPLSALFSAMSLSLAMFAKSSKEGQYYLTPLLMVTMGLTMFCLNPSIELTPYYSVLPVVGPALLLKALLLGGATSSVVWMYAVPVLVTSFAYSALALWWAIEQFQSEGILFREAERFELGLWIKHLLRDKEETPSFTEAGVCFVMIAMLQFVFLTSMQSNPNLLGDANGMVVVQLIYLIATVGVPPVIMAILLTKLPLRSLKLKLPSWKMLGVAVVLPLSLQPLAMELLSRLDPFFPPIPPGAEQMMSAMSEVPLWLSFVTFAIAPAVCEELAFRGFILSGFQRSRHKWLPIVISAILFGVIHMIPKQQFNASLLGLALGLLAVRSKSLIPCIIFHAIFNGTQVFASQLEIETLQDGFTRHLVTFSKTAEGLDTMAFNPVFLAVCGVVSAGILYWLVKLGDESPEAPELTPSANSHVAEASN